MSAQTAQRERPLELRELALPAEAEQEQRKFREDILSTAGSTPGSAQRPGLECCCFRFRFLKDGKGHSGTERVIV